MATSAIPTFADTYNQWFANEMLPFAQNYTSANLDPANFQKDASGYYIATPDAPVWSWTTGPDYWAQKQALDQQYLSSLAAYNAANNTNIQPNQSVLGAVQPNPVYRAPDSGGWLSGVTDVLGGAADLVGSAVNSVGNFVTNHPLEAAALVAGGYYFAPEIGAWISPAGEAVAGTEAGATTEALSGVDLGGVGASPNTWMGGSTYGAIPEAVAGTGTITSAMGGATAEELAAASAAAGAGAGAAGTGLLSSLTPAQTALLAKAGLTTAGLLGGTAALSGLTGGSSGGVSLPVQDRSGVSSGSAQYSPEYYAAIQSKYNQLMPQQPRDVTTDLKNWYETKYAPSVTPKVA